MANSFIKSVTMSGFKSYRSQLDFDEFDPKINVIVGKNGSGKSNFFRAIRFVLGEVNLSSEERKLLLHEGGGNSSLNALVEIKFDNQKMRFPIDKKEVTLARQIGLSKDEYFLDKKHVSKQEVINFLESAGLSRSNPYYIVQQGKIDQLAQMEETERLALFKDVAGVKVYEERRKETFKILQETDTQRKTIGGTLEYIQERINELEEEKEELIRYQEKDKDKRALEYLLHNGDLNQVLQDLKDNEGKRVGEADQANEIHRNARNTQLQVRTNEREMKTLQVEVRQLTKGQGFLEIEKEDTSKDRARHELEVKDWEDKLQKAKEANQHDHKELQQLDKQIKKLTNEYDDLKPKFEKEAKAEEDLKTKLQQAEHDVSNILGKQGRGNTFSSPQERDKFLQSEVQKLQSELDTKKKTVQSHQQEVQQTEKTITTLEKTLKTNHTELDKSKKLAEQIMQQLGSVKESRDDLSNKRKIKWREQEGVEQNVEHYKSEFAKAEKALQASVSPIITNGLNAIKRITREKNLTGVYGPLIELFNCHPDWNTAVEVTAGTALFFVVVDTDETASKLLEALGSEGRITLMPLNRLNVKTPKYPDTRESSPLVNLLEFKPMFKKAFLHIFGKTLVCQNLDVATQFADKYGFDCITPHGDQVNRKGAITGGYAELFKSRLESMQAIKKWKGSLEKVAQTREQNKQELQGLDQKITNVLGQMEELESKKQSTLDAIRRLDQEIKAQTKSLTDNKEVLELKRHTLQELESSQKEMSQSIKELKAEVGTKLSLSLSPAEQKQLKDLNAEIVTLKNQLVTQSTNRSLAETKLKNLENTLESNLKLRREELTGAHTEFDTKQLQLELEAARRELGNATKQISGIVETMKVNQKALDDNAKRIQELKDQIDDMKNNENSITKQLLGKSEAMEKLLIERKVLNEKKEDAERKIRNIGSLPTAQVKLWQDKQLSVPAQRKQLKKVNEELKKFSVNQKARDQYINFSEQRSRLLSRQETLDQNAERIGKLIDVLDQQKTATMYRTFRGVGKIFETNFAKLAPKGSAHLVLRHSDIDKELVGIGIVAKFNPDSELHPISQLSSGERSLLALTLILAIQELDPAPFYLFDEVDAHLDARSRLAVANMLRDRANRVPSEDSQDNAQQFICSSFREELVQVADKCYGVSFRAKESKIRPISKGEALKVIREAPTISPPEFSSESDNRSQHESSVEEDD